MVAKAMKMFLGQGASLIVAFPLFWWFAGSVPCCKFKRSRVNKLPESAKLYSSHSKRSAKAAKKTAITTVQMILG